MSGDDTRHRSLSQKKKDMTKKEIVYKIVKSTGLPMATVLATVELLIDTIKKNLVEGKQVYLKGFGTFMVKRRQSKPARNIKTGERVIIPAHNRPVWLPNPDFKDMIAKKLKPK